MSLATEIIDIVFKYRRSLNDAHEYRHFCEECNFPHIDKIHSAIQKQEQIQFILPAFPVKSPNMNKVLGELPDKGEELALDFLNNLCKEIQNLYLPGAKLTICSDGHVFSDLLRVHDETVNHYNAELKRMIQKQALDYIEMFDLNHVFGKETDFDSKRTQLVSEYGQSKSEIRNLILNTPRELSMFKGIKKFLIGDFSFLEPSKSKSAIDKLCHDIAYSMIQRSHAWSSLVEKYFPNAVRLSIHPQPCHYQKIGIYLIESKDNWLTPWHGVAVKMGEKFELMKKSDALERGAKLVEEQGRPYYFVLS